MKNNNKWKILISIVSILCALSLVFMVVSIIKRNDPKDAQFIRPEFDQTVQTGSPTPPDDLGYSVMNISKGYNIGICGNLKVYDKDKVDVYFTSAEDNIHYVKIRLTDSSGKILSETGIIKPGEYIKTLTIKESPSKTEQVNIKIMGYEKGTWHSAGTVNLNTNLNVI